MIEAQIDLARPFTPSRLRTYLAIAGIGNTVPVLCALGVGSGLVDPTRTLDVLGNAFAFLPMVLLPLAVVVLTEPGLERAADLVLVWLPFTVAAQLTFEIVWLVGQLFDTWHPTGDPGWKWMWWQFAQTDTRYFGENPYIFGMELLAVVAAVVVLVSLRGLLRTGLEPRARIRALWLALLGLAALTANTLVYFASAFRNGLGDIGQGDYGVVKFVALNGPYLVVPVFVLIALWRQIDHLYLRAASR